MGMVQRDVKTELFCKKGHFLIKNDKGRFSITNPTNNTVQNYDASNGFDCYLDNITLFSSTKEEVIPGTDGETQTVETRVWTFDMHDEEGDYYEMKFYVGAERSGSTFFGFINSLASISEFGLLKLTAKASDFKVNGKDDIEFTHIQVVNFVNGMPYPVYHKYKKGEYPDFEIKRDSTGKAILKPGGYTSKDYSKRLQFFENLIPGIVQNIQRSKYPQALLSSGQAYQSLPEYVEEYQDMPGMDEEPPAGYQSPVRTAKTMQQATKDSLYPQVDDNGDVQDLPF